ncbi:hypothetical protein ADK88_29840 [Streptomyces sp. NRRL F-2295]|nr:hypothetical protein ADK88_29840 [Streptomyces sp. NRRL F-2295]
MGWVLPISVPGHLLFCVELGEQITSTEPVPSKVSWSVQVSLVIMRVFSKEILVWPTKVHIRSRVVADRPDSLPPVASLDGAGCSGSGCFAGISNPMPCCEGSWDASHWISRTIRLPVPST